MENPLLSELVPALANPILPVLLTFLYLFNQAYKNWQRAQDELKAEMESRERMQHERPPVPASMAHHYAKPAVTNCRYCGGGVEGNGDCPRCGAPQKAKAA